jgi:hypothetical protein
LNKSSVKNLISTRNNAKIDKKNGFKNNKNPQNIICVASESFVNLDKYSIENFGIPFFLKKL